MQILLIISLILLRVLGPSINKDYFFFIFFVDRKVFNNIENFMLRHSLSIDELLQHIIKIKIIILLLNCYQNLNRGNLSFL